MQLKIDILGCESRYECKDLDAGLPLHAHEPGSGLEHDVRCDYGRICVFIWPRERRMLFKGMTLKFDATRWHGIYPLEVGSRFTNTSRQPQQEFHSTLDSPHNAPDWAVAK